MMRLVIFVLLVFGVAAPSRAQPAKPDAIITDFALRGVERQGLSPDGVVIDLRMGRVGSVAQAVAWLESHQTADGSSRAKVSLALCEEHFRHTRYAAALDACEAGERSRPGSATSILPLLRLLQTTPEMRWTRSGVRIPMTEMKFHVSGNGQNVEAFFDTGAELSVIMESVARQLGARPADSPVTLGTTTTPVAGDLAVLDRLTIGGAELLNIPVVILPDEELTFEDGGRLPLILGLSAIVPLRRAAFVNHGAELLLGDAAPPHTGSETASLYWDASGVGFSGGFHGGDRAVHFDTGSARDYLFPSAISALSSQELSSRTAHERKIAGLGGERTEQAWRFDQITLKIAGLPWVIAPMEMAETDESGEAARLGSNLVSYLDTMVLDFGTMTLSVKP